MKMIHRCSPLHDKILDILQDSKRLVAAEVMKYSYIDKLVEIEDAISRFGGNRTHNLTVSAIERIHKWLMENKSQTPTASD